MSKQFQKIKKTALTIGTAISGMALSAGTAFAAIGALGTVEEPTVGYAKDIGTLISNSLNIIMLVAAILVFLYLMLGGIEWITSGGDKGKTEGARNKITAAIVGLIVLAASYALLQLSLGLLGYNDGIQGVFKNVNPLTQSKTTE